MRNAFALEMEKLAGENENVVLLSGDIGNRMFDRYKEKYADRFYNCGVAEANMTSVAAGLAIAGMKPVTYTITSFNTTRCFEQIRVDVCYQNLPVIIVGTGAGLSYAELGATHHSCEDIAIMRTLPNMTIMCPGDANEVHACLAAAMKHDGPVYIRIGKKNEPRIHKETPELVLGKAFIISKGETVALISTGNTLPLAVDAANKLKEEGVDVEVVSMHTVKPLDGNYLSGAFDKFSHIVTIEEHGLIGGLGSAVSDWMIENERFDARLVKFGVPDKFMSKCGKQEEARESCGLTVDNIVQTVLNKVEK